MAWARRVLRSGSASRIVWPIGTTSSRATSRSFCRRTFLSPFSVTEIAIEPSQVDSAASPRKVSRRLNALINVSWV
jgi:hypothetical protein